MTHSILPPSSAGIWGKPGGCNGWVLMAQTYPETEGSIESREGTASHEIGADLIITACTNTGKYNGPEGYIGRAATNGVVFTDEMFDAAEMYADDVGGVMRRTGVFSGPDLRVETRVEAPSVHVLSWGTPDCVLYHRAGKALYIWDYKFGHGTVEAFENWQLINYVAGILDELSIDGHEAQSLKIHMRVVQPRAFHREGPVREWVVTASELRAHINTLSANADLALRSTAKANTGTHCRYCPGRHACQAALSAGASLYEASTAPTPVELSAESVGVQLAIIRRARRQLEYLESGFEEQVESMLRAGASVPGWTVEGTRSQQVWSEPVGAVSLLGDMLGVDLRKPEAVISPKKALKLGVDSGVITAYSTRTKTGTKVVPDDNSKARKVFNK